MLSRKTLLPMPLLAFAASCTLAVGLTCAPHSAYAADNEAQPSLVQNTTEDEEQNIVWDEATPSTTDEAAHDNGTATENREDTPAIDTSLGSTGADEQDSGLLDNPTADLENADPQYTEFAEDPTSEPTEQPGEAPADDLGTSSDPIAPPADAVVPSANLSHKQYLETSVADSLVLTAGKAEAGSAVTSSTYKKGSTLQEWTISAAADNAGWYHIGLSTSPQELLLGAGEDGTLMLLSPSETSGTRALWAFLNASSSGYQLACAAFPEFLMTVRDGSTATGSPVELAPTQDTSASQRFHLLDATPSVKPGVTDAEMSYNIRQTGTSRMVEVRRASTDNGADVWLYTSAGTSQHQKIYLEATGDGYYTAWVVGTGKVLDMRGSALIPGTNVFQWASTGAANQQWALYANGDGTYRLINRATGLVLAKSSTSVTLVGARDDGSSACSFDLVPVNMASAGIYRIRPRTNTAVSLDVRKASTGTAELMLYKNTDALNQRFELVSAGGTNLWYIRTGSSGGWISCPAKGLVQTGSSASNKTDVSVWRLTFKGGWFSFINKSNGKAIDMRGGKTVSGTSVIAYASNGKDSQHFTLVSASLINAGTFYLQSAYGTRADVKGASTAAGANIATWSKNASSNDLNQRFRLVKSGAGYQIVNAKSGLVLTPSDLYRANADSIPAAISNVTQRLSANKSYQLWKPQIADGGYVRFVNMVSGRALTATGKAAGSNIEQLPKADDSVGQRWKLVSASADDAAKTKSASTKVLIIGNSFTFYNDLPTLLLQQKAGVEAVACSRGSAYLKDHTSTTDGLGKRTRAAISEGGWDYVVIQAQSTEAIDDYSTYLANLKILVDLVHKAGAKPIIYGTWAFAGGSNGTKARYGDASQSSLDLLSSELQKAFNRAAKDNSIKAVNGGKAVTVADTGAQFTSRRYTANLYCDGKHASVLGSKLVAQVITQCLK